MGVFWKTAREDISEDLRQNIETNLLEDVGELGMLLPFLKISKDRNILTLSGRVTGLTVSRSFPSSGLGLPDSSSARAAGFVLPEAKGVIAEPLYFEVYLKYRETKLINYAESVLRAGENKPLKMKGPARYDSDLETCAFNPTTIELSPHYILNVNS